MNRRLVAAITMNQMFAAWGYVRLLGLAHLLFWTPAWAWILSKRGSIAADSWYGRYVRVCLVIAGTSLIIDAVAVVRYLLGDTAA